MRTIHRPLMKSRPTKRAVTTLIDGAEAFMTGHYAEHLIERGEPVESWAWTNLLAHGSASDLLEPKAVAQRDMSSAIRSWLRARNYLAGEVLNVADGSVPLPRLQRTVLIPLEARLAHSADAQRWTPGTWAATVMSSLDQHRSTHPDSVSARGHHPAP